VIEKTHQCEGAGDYLLEKDGENWVIYEGDRYPEITVDFCPWCGIKLDA